MPTSDDIVAAESDADVYCPHCAYNLRGAASALCPECGQPFDRADLLRSRLPWAQRARIGNVRAFWRTVALVIFKRQILLAELAGPVDLAHARRFWAWVVLHAWTPFVVAALMCSFDALTPRRAGLVEESLASDIGSHWPIVCFALGALGWLFAATGAATYFCHPRRLDVERQNRAIALAYYAGAPLALLAPVSPIFAAAFWFAVRADSDPLGLAAGIGSAIVVLAALLLTYLRTLTIVRVSADRGRAFAAAFAGLLPLLWLLLFALLAVILPLMLCYVGLFLATRSA